MGPSSTRRLARHAATSALTVQRSIPGRRARPLRPDPTALVLLGDPLPARSLLGPQPGVGARRDPGHLPLELVEREQPALRQLSVLDRGPDRTTRLRTMRAVGAPARRG